LINSRFKHHIAYITELCNSIPLWKNQQTANLRL